MTTQYKWMPSEPTEGMIEALKPYLSRSYDTHIKAAYKAMWQATPEVEQELYGYVHSDTGAFYLANDVFISESKQRNYTKVYTHPQPKREPCTVTRHEVREAMMFCEVNHCDDPDAYTLDILKRLGIRVEK